MSETTAAVWLPKTRAGAGFRPATESGMGHLGTKGTVGRSPLVGIFFATLLTGLMGLLITIVLLL